MAARMSLWKMDLDGSASPVVEETLATELQTTNNQVHPDS